MDFDHLQIQLLNTKDFKHRLTTLASEQVPTLTNQAISINTLSRCIKTAVLRAEIGKQLTSHTLRHSFQNRAPTPAASLRRCGIGPATGTVGARIGVA
jgi:site-specific recombinase XerD